MKYFYQQISKTMNQKGHIYVFSYNRTLLETSLEDLKRMKEVRMRYLQIDTKHKCVPSDWHLGYDTLAVYTFLQLSKSKGYLKNFEETFLVDYENDFYEIKGFFGYIFLKGKVVILAFFELFLIMALVKVASDMFI